MHVSKDTCTVSDKLYGNHPKPEKKSILWCSLYFFNVFFCLEKKRKKRKEKKEG